MIQAKRRAYQERLYVFLYVAGLNAILLIDVDIPAYIEEGSNATLSCLFEVEYDGLYR